MKNITKKEISYPYLDRPVVVYERECGHKIVCAHKEGGLINIASWVKTGSINENDQNTGVSHFLEHLMFKGTHKYKAGHFDRVLEAKGAVVNAATWKDYTFYYVTMPQGENFENFELLLELHADMMLDPILPEDEIGLPFDLNDENIRQKRERHVVIEEIRMRQDQPWSVVYNILNSNMYKTHPYRRDVIGTQEVISSISRADIMKYYQTNYAPNTMTTIVVGDFEPDDVIEKICANFDFKNRPNSQIKDYQIDAPTSVEQYFEQKADINTAFLMFGFLGAKAVDIKQNIAFEMISIILGEGQSSRMYQNLIEKAEKSIFNVVQTDYHQFRDGGNFFVQANFKPESKDLAIELIKKELENVVTQKITESEFNKAKKKLKANFAQSSETVSEISDNIGYYMSVCDDLSLVEKYCDELETITIDDVYNTAKEYLPMQKATVSLLMPRSELPV